jgi:hypothetical protein
MRGAASRTYIVNLADVEDILKMAEFEAYDMDSHEVVKKAFERLQQIGKAYLPSRRNERNGDKFAVGWNECVDAIRRNIKE